MRKITTLTLFMSASLIAGMAAHADDQNSSDQYSDQYSSDQSGNTYNEQNADQQPGMLGDESTGVTTKSAEEVTGGRLKDEGVSVRPQAGLLLFNDRNTSTTNAARAAAGLTLDVNATKYFLKRTPTYIGAQLGLIYSHVGSPGSGFFGATTGSLDQGGGSNFLELPFDLKLGYALTDAFRISAHGGMNWTYRSYADSFNFGTNSQGSSGVWRPYPNAGADIDFGVAKNVSLSLRPDWTFTPGDNYFTGTLAIAFPIS